MCVNYSGEIIGPKTIQPLNDENQRLPSAVTDSASGPSLVVHERKKNMSMSNISKEKGVTSIKVLCKDEFGRDVLELKHKHNHSKGDRKHLKHFSSKSRSRSTQRHTMNTLPPPDPYRPHLDEDRGRRIQQHRHQPNQSQRRDKRDRSRYRGHSQRCRDRKDRLDSYQRYHRQSFSRSRSRSRGRRRRRSRSSRSHQIRLSTSVERQWTHNAFSTRSPSPPRSVNPLYRPEPETWVSRAGGVYIPRK